MSANTSAYLQAAIILGIEIDVVYAGGSQPGKARRLLPQSIRNDVLKARTGGATKSFKIALITVVHNAVDVRLRNYTGIQDILLREQKLILNSGLLLVADRFHLSLSDDNRLILNLHRNQGRWLVNSLPFSDFQAAAEAFVTALYIVTEQLKEQ